MIARLRPDGDNVSACCTLVRPLTRADKSIYDEFLSSMPKDDLQFIQHRITDRSKFHEWPDSLDYECDLPLLALIDSQVVGDATLRWQDSLIIAGCFIPTAMIGGWLGAKLTHSLRIRYVRIAFILLLCWAAWKMLGLMELINNDHSANAFSG